MLTNDIIGIVFLLLLIVIYIPQYHKICKNKSSQGLNAWFMFFGHTACWWSWSNTLIFYINGWWSCQGATNCSESFIGFGIVVVQWLLYFIMYIMYLKYLHEPHEFYYPRIKVTNKKMAIITFSASILLSVLKTTVDLLLLQKYNWHNPLNPTNSTNFIDSKPYLNSNMDSNTTTVYLLDPNDPTSNPTNNLTNTTNNNSVINPNPSDLMGWTAFAEVIILSFFLVHYIPQIYETYQQKTAGSISLITLAFMCPGTFVWTIYLALQGKIIDNNKQASNPIVWVPYLIVFIMQGVLLGMGLYYEREKKRKMYLLFDKATNIIDKEEDELLNTPETINW